MSLAVLNQPKQHRIDFIQAIRVLRQIGRGDSIQLSAEPMPVGAPAEVVDIELLGSDARVKLGLEALSGAKGVLPDYLYEELLASLHDEEQALSDFLDLFNHRYFQLFQGTLERGNLLLRDEQEQAEQQLLTRLPQRECLANLSALPNSSAADTGLLAYSVLLGLKSRSLSGLRQLLSDYFQVQVHVHAVPSTKYRLPENSVSRIGAQGGQNNVLGRGCLLGRIGRLNFHRLEVWIEPTERSQFERLKADNQFSKVLRKLTEAYLREVTDLKLYLYVKRAFIAQPVLSSASEAGVRLGEANCLAPQHEPEEYRKILLQ